MFSETIQLPKAKTRAYKMIRDPRHGHLLKLSKVGECAI